jgi:signal transduction histidine kinase
VRLSEIPRTTSFRLSVLFLALFGGASLALFGFIYWQTSRYLTSSVDERLARDARGYLSNPGDTAARLRKHVELDPQDIHPFGLFTRGGRHIAGNLTALPRLPLPLGRPFEFRRAQDGRMRPYRALALRLPPDELLVLSESIYETDELRELLRNTMAWGGVFLLVVGLAGAGITGLGAVRRINAVTGAIERIVTGDLAGRLPMDRGAGDLDRLSLLVNRMLDDIERLMGEVKGVTDDIAHDLRTPLTRLLAGLERARRRSEASPAGAAAEYERAVEEAIRETRGLLGTFSALLRIAELEDSARRAGFTRVDLATIAADVAEFQAPVAEEKGVALEFERPQPPAEGTLALSGDPSLLFEAIGNLVENAVKFTPAGGRIRICAFAVKGRIGVSVSDTGPGIPAAEREAVLRRFHRLEKSRHTPGSGLGLSLVAAVARLHGLDLGIESAHPGCRVTLSAAAAPGPPTAARQDGASGGGVVSVS